MDGKAKRKVIVQFHFENGGNGRARSFEGAKVTRFTLKKIRDRNLFSFNVRYVSVTGRRVTQDFSIYWQYAWLYDFVQKKLQKCAKLYSSMKEYRIGRIFLLSLTRETSLCLLEKFYSVSRKFWKRMLLWELFFLFRIKK